LKDAALLMSGDCQRRPLHINLFKPRIINDFQASKYYVASRTMLSGIENYLQAIEKMEREMGLEPTASSLGS
jgi:hypothetical protein